jgi:zinc protease
LKKILCATFFFVLLIFNIQAKYEASEFVLKNGLRVVCIKKSTVPIVAFSIWYKCGSKCDAFSKSGTAHYLEHMAFVSNKEYEDFLEKIGAEYNAFTSIGTICFYEIVPKEHMETVFRCEADRMRSIRISDEVFFGEKGAILEERSMRVDNDPSGVQGEVFQANMFNRKIGGIEIIGWKHEINALQKQDLYDFHDKWFFPNNATIVIVGDFDLEDLKIMLKKYFENIQAKKLPQENDDLSVPTCFKEISYGSPKNGLLASILYLYQMPFLSKKDFKKSMIMDLAIKTINQASFFVKKSLKSVTRLVDEVSFLYVDRLFQYDFAGVNISCDSIDDLLEADKIWCYLKNKLINVGISKTDLDAIKQREMISLAYKKDDIAQMANYFGWLLSCGCSLAEILSIDDLIQSITPQECNDVLRDVFSQEHMSVMKIVPKGYNRD